MSDYIERSVIERLLAIEAARAWNRRAENG